MLTNLTINTIYKPINLICILHLMKQNYVDWYLCANWNSLILSTHKSYYPVFSKITISLSLSFSLSHFLSLYPTPQLHVYCLLFFSCTIIVSWDNKGCVLFCSIEIFASCTITVHIKMYVKTHMVEKTGKSKPIWLKIQSTQNHYDWKYRVVKTITIENTG